MAWNDRHKYYNDELALSRLEEASLELVYWLEDKGYPAIIVPPTHVDPWSYDGDPSEHLGTLISLPHAAVEAGLGTLGLNLQLLTPEYGPRVLLTAVLCSVEAECDPQDGDRAMPRAELRALPEDMSRRRGRGIGIATGLRATDSARRTDLPIFSEHITRIIAEPDAREAEGLGAFGGKLQSLAEHSARRWRDHRLPPLR